MILGGGGGGGPPTPPVSPPLRASRPSSDPPPAIPPGRGPRKPNLLNAFIKTTRVSSFASTKQQHTAWPGLAPEATAQLGPPPSHGTNTAGPARALGPRQRVGGRQRGPFRRRGIPAPLMQSSSGPVLVLQNRVRPSAASARPSRGCPPSLRLAGVRVAGVRGGGGGAGAARVRAGAAGAEAGRGHLLRGLRLLIGCGRRGGGLGAEAQAGPGGEAQRPPRVPPSPDSPFLGGFLAEFSCPLTSCSRLSSSRFFSRASSSFVLPTGFFRAASGTERRAQPRGRSAPSPTLAQWEEGGQGQHRQVGPAVLGRHTHPHPLPPGKALPPGPRLASGSLQGWPGPAVQRGRLGAGPCLGPRGCEAAPHAKKLERGGRSHFRGGGSPSLLATPCAQPRQEAKTCHRTKNFGPNKRGPT